MKTKHTPGPWFAVDYAGRYSIQNGPMYEDKDLLSYDSISGTEYSVTKEEAEANAALMIAAPDLLKALYELVKAVRTRTSVGHDMIHELIESEKAIQKATKPLS